MRAKPAVLVTMAALSACSAGDRASPATPPSAPTAQLAETRAEPPSSSVAPAPPASAASPSNSASPSTTPTFAKAAASLFLDDATRADVAACAGAPEPIQCLVHLRYDADADADHAAQDFFERRGCLAGLERPSTFDGGWRGTIRVVPELPIGRYRRHLVDAAAGVNRLDDFVAELRARAPKPVRYRARDITFRFFRSVGRTTPSAFAEKWSIAYNVSGSLLGTEGGVRETLVHEIFHLNDEGRGPGGENWSVRALGPTFDAIVARCGTNAACLAPYAPARTMVRGGTYYAFQPGGGVHEYAAELAVRYVQETEAALGKTPRTSPPFDSRGFKCGPPENARAWDAIVDEFFGGLDLTPRCPR